MSSKFRGKYLQIIPLGKELCIDDVFDYSSVPSDIIDYRNSITASRKDVVVC